MENNIYSAPKATLEKNTEMEEGILASRWERLWASLIDTLTILPISLALMYFTNGFDGLSEGLTPSLSYTLIMAVISTAIFLAIHGRIIVRDGQTWGKKAQKIKIVTTAGDHPSIGVLVKRYGFYWGAPQIPFVGQFISMVNILFIFSKSKKCIHDHIASTKVVKVNKLPNLDAE